MSADGRFVVFESNADNLVAGDVNFSTDVFRREIATGAIVLVSSAADGSHTSAGSASGEAQISADGRYVVFRSEADNLVAGDTNERTDIFRKDLQTGEILRVSTAGDPAHTQANEDSDYASISSDGRYVVFQSYADNLVVGDTNGGGDTFRKDMTTGEIVRLTSPNAAVGHVEGNAGSLSGTISNDGHYLVFLSGATNLVASDTNKSSDIFRKDLLTGAIELVSTAADGAHTQGNNSSNQSSVSADGRYVVFESYATNLVTGDGNNTHDVFRKDLSTGDIVLVSSAGDAAHTQSDKRSDNPAISADGRYVLFTSQGTNLVAGDTLGFLDIFRKDLVTGDLVLVSASSDGTTPANNESNGANMSADGRYVVFSSLASNIVAADTNGKSDVFWKDLTTGEVKLLSTANMSATQGNQDSYNPCLSANGIFVVFESNASNLVGNDLGSNRDIFRKNMSTGETLLVSSASGVQGNDRSFDADVSADGRYVVFGSYANNLVAGDTNGVQDVFLKDMQTGAISRISTAGDASHMQGNQQSFNAHFSADGRYVVFDSNATRISWRGTPTAASMSSAKIW